MTPLKTPLPTKLMVPAEPTSIRISCSRAGSTTTLGPSLSPLQETKREKSKRAETRRAEKGKAEGRKKEEEVAGPAGFGNGQGGEELLRDLERNRVPWGKKSMIIFPSHNNQSAVSLKPFSADPPPVGNCHYRRGYMVMAYPCQPLFFKKNLHGNYGQITAFFLGKSPLFPGNSPPFSWANDLFLLPQKRRTTNDLPPLYRQKQIDIFTKRPGDLAGFG